jgi:uncharacterized protein YaaQ
MKHYLSIEIESDDHNEIIIRVDPLYCTVNGKGGLNLKNQEYIPTKGDKLYFMPGVNIPRVKLKDLTMQYGIKAVRDIDDATHIFGGRNTEAKMVNTSWYYTMPTETFRNIYEKIKDNVDEYYKEDVESALEFYNEDVVLFTYNTASEFRNTEHPAFKQAIEDEEFICNKSSEAVYLVDEAYKSYFPKILSLEIYDEAQLLKYINGDDAVIIDETMFNQLSDMFKSSDKDNHILAMEIMANSNYIDSLLYIEFLFKEYHHQMSSCPTKNHVNFKSLVSFLGKNRTYMSTNLDDVMRSLIRKNVLTTDKINIIMDKYYHEIQSSGNTEYFKVKTITVNEEALKTVNNNFIFKVQEDFVPEVEEVLEEHAVIEDIQVPEDIQLEQQEPEFAAEDNFDIVEEAIEDTEVPVELEPESNNNQIKETNGGDDFEWF